MTQTTISRVTLQSIENYRSAATQAVAAYRVGGRRAVGAINGALKNSVYPRTAKLAPGATERMNVLRGNVSEFVVKGIDQIAKGADKAIKLGSTAAAAQVTKAARLTNRVDNETMANGLQAAARLTMPGARVALAVSGKVSQGASALADAIGARPVRKTARKAAAKPAAKRAQASRSKPARRAVRKAK